MPSSSLIRTLICICPAHIQGEVIIEEIESYEDEGEEEEENDEMPDMPVMDLDMDLDLFDLDNNGTEEEEAVLEEEAPQKRYCTKTIKIPPVWVPTDNRTHAALIYVFFRGQTGPFLPPDPVPEPPHVIMAFDAYKRKDLINMAERYIEDVPFYGFFTSDDPEEADFLGNSLQKYAQQAHSA